MENIQDKIEQIVKRALTLSDCPVKRMNEEWRRINLTKAINTLLDEQRANMATVSQVSAIEGKVLQPQDTKGTESTSEAVY